MPTDFVIAIPSRQRADQVITIQNTGIPARYFHLFVDTKEEEAEYTAKNPGATVHLTGVTGIQHVRNKILDTFPVDARVVTMCDDVQGVWKLTGPKKLEKMVGPELIQFINDGFQACEDAGTKLWGVYPIKNHFFMSQSVARDAFIIGTFSGIIVSDIRCDKQLPLKEDYDYTIKHIQEYGCALRLNNVAVEAKHYKNKGGCVDYRCTELEQQAIARLKELYPGIIRDNTKRPNEILMRFKKHGPKWYSSPRWSAEIADCSMPMTFDQHNNCGYKCLYCFATFQRATGGKTGTKMAASNNARKEAYLAGEVTPVNVGRVKKIFTELDSSQFGPYVADKRVMQWGGMGDPFCPFEKKLGTGLELLKFFKEIDYPLCLSTKGTWWLNDERYTELFRGQKNWNVKVSIITLDKEKARVIEEGCPTPKRRLEAIEKIAKLDCGGATLRLRPFMIGITNPTHVELIKEAAARGATAVSTEFFCLEKRSAVLKEKLKVISKQAGMDYGRLYRDYSKGAGYLRLNRNIKRQFIDEMQEAAHGAGMRFYVSDAHFKERSDNGCCCGLGESWNYSRGQFCEALVICKQRGEVKWGDIAPHTDVLSGFLWRLAENFNTVSAKKRSKFYTHTMQGYLRWLWNNPEAGQSPYTMFEGIMKPTGKDEHGDLIYSYCPERE
jgi:DNA repair photolyase